MNRYQYKKRTSNLLVGILIPIIYLPFFVFIFNRYITEPPEFISWIFYLLFIISSAIFIVSGYRRYNFFISLCDDSILMNGGKTINFSKILDVDIGGMKDNNGKEIEYMEIYYEERGLKQKLKIYEDLIGYEDLSNKLIRIAKENRDNAR